MTAGLKLEPNIRRPDEVYARLVGLHEGLSDDESHRASSALVLLLANHIGDETVIFAAFEAARRQLRPATQGSGVPPGAGGRSWP